MAVEQWNEIFTLLSMVILADERVYKEEVDTFVARAMEIKASMTDDVTLITSDIVFEWFRGNRENIAKILKSEDSHETALKSIHSLARCDSREAVLRAMVAVSMADKEYHPTEESLIKTAAAHWGLKVRGVSGAA